MNYALLATFALLNASAASFANGLHRRNPLLPAAPRSYFSSVPKQLNEMQPGQILIRYSVEKAEALERSAKSIHAQALGRRVTGPMGEVFLNRVAPTGWTVWSVSSNTDTKALAEHIRQTYSDAECAEPV